MSESAGQLPTFSRTAALWMVLVGVVSFAGLLILTAYAPSLRNGDGRAHVLSRSAVGYAALTQLLKASGEQVTISRGPLRLGTKVGLIIITPEMGQGEEEISVDIAGPRVIIVPKWDTVKHPTRRGWVVARGTSDAEILARTLLTGYAPNSTIQRREASAQPRLFSDGAPFPSPGPIKDFQTLAGPHLTPIVTDETGGIVLGQVNNTYFVSDPDLMNTQGLKDLRTARTALALVERVKDEDETIVIDATVPGFARTRSVLRLAFEPPFLGATLCLAAAALLLGLHAAIRFGPRRQSGRVFALGKAALVDNSAGLIRMARREHRMAERYALALRSQVARAIGAPPDLESEALNAFLDRAGASLGAGAFSELLARARRAANTTDLMRIARELHAWRGEMIRERR